MLVPNVCRTLQVVAVAPSAEDPDSFERFGNQDWIGGASRPALPAAS